MPKVKRPKLPKGRERFLSNDERIRLLAACKESSNAMLLPIVTLALSTAMRRSEIMNLKRQNINLNDGYILLTETKNHETRRIPLTGAALNLLIEHAKVQHIGTDLLWPGKNILKPIDLTFHWKKALKVAQIDNFVFHDLRHSAASYMAMNGAGLITIAKLLGHRTLAMVQRYSHLSDNHLDDAVADMNQKIFG